MKRVVIVGPEFAPSSLPNAQRIRFFAHHLSEFGWYPIVLTVQPQYYESVLDPHNERLLPSTLEVRRTRALPLGITRKFGLGDIGLRSIWFHWRELSMLCRSKQVDLVLISSPPGLPILLGFLTNLCYKVPYVVDYQDPWRRDEYWKLPRAERRPKLGLAHILARVVEPVALRRVSHIVGVSSGTVRAVIRPYSWLRRVGMTAIPLGGEPADFEYLRAHPRCNAIFDQNDGQLHVSYVGACIPAMDATVRALFEGVRNGLGRNPSLFSRLRLHFVGTTYDPSGAGEYRIMSLAKEAGIDRLVDEHPARVSYLDALQLLLDSHALLIVGSDAPHYTASKIFPGILAHRPLLAIFHEASSVVDIVQRTRSGTVITYNNKESPPITRAIAISKQLERILNFPPDYQVPTRWEVVQSFTATAMTAHLASIFDRVLHNSNLRKT